MVRQGITGSRDPVDRSLDRLAHSGAGPLSAPANVRRRPERPVARSSSPATASTSSSRRSTRARSPSARARCSSSAKSGPAVASRPCSSSTACRPADRDPHAARCQDDGRDLDAGLRHEPGQVAHAHHVGDDDEAAGHTHLPVPAHALEHGLRRRAVGSGARRGAARSSPQLGHASGRPRRPSPWPRPRRSPRPGAPGPGHGPPTVPRSTRASAASARHSAVTGRLPQLQVRVDGPLEVVDGRVEVTGEASGDAERSLDGPEAHDGERRHDRQVGVGDQLAGRRTRERPHPRARQRPRPPPTSPTATRSNGGWRQGRGRRPDRGPGARSRSPVQAANTASSAGKVSSACSIRLGDEVTSVTSF